MDTKVMLLSVVLKHQFHQLNVQIHVIHHHVGKMHNVVPVMVLLNVHVFHRILAIPIQLVVAPNVCSTLIVQVA